MTKIADQIDGMLVPDLSGHFSHQGRQTIMQALGSAKQQARPYSGDFRASWLLSEFDAPVWVTTNRGREELVNQAWQNAVTIDWRAQLPNGSLLTAPCNHRLLRMNREIAFLARSGHVSQVSAPKVWRALVAVQLQLTRWVVLHEDRFMPEKYGFRLLDQPSLDGIFDLLSEGGWQCAHQFPQRIVMALHAAAFDRPCPQDLIEDTYVLPAHVVQRFTEWLTDRGYYGRVSRGAHTGKRYLKRETVASLIGAHVEGMKLSGKLSAFLRQFEPDFQDSRLLLNIYQSTEKPEHQTRTVEDVIGTGTAEKNLDSVAQNIATILSAHRHIPDLLPDPGSISVASARSLALRRTRHTAHTPFMPVNIGLAYLATAIRFVHLYGEPLVGYYLAVASTRTPKTTSAELDESIQRMSGEWRISSGKPVADVLNISGFLRASPSRDFDLLRVQPTLDDALRVLIGSCVVAIAILKPSRQDELTHLRRDCLRKDSGGYHLRFDLGKSNIIENHQSTDRPIPVISAKAISLLQRLGSGLVKLNDDTRKASANLFYIPRMDGRPGAMKADSGLLSAHLDLLCDYVGLPVDQFGRRWYVRIHEMRKWFLLLLFWSGRYDVLDAARWIAGHNDALHIYAYIEREFPGEELPKLEAEYAIDRLRELEAGSRDGRSQAEVGLDALYEAVLHHFKVESLAMVPDAEWTDYVNALRAAEGFVLEPHSIFSPCGSEVQGINVSFVLRESIK